MIGYRFWSFRLDEGNSPDLTSFAIPYVWGGNVVGESIKELAQILDCGKYSLNGKINSIYDLDCQVPQLGFYAFKTPIQAVLNALNMSEPCIIGIVNGFGKVAVHSKGYRAEYMQILGFLDQIPCTKHSDQTGNILVTKHGTKLSTCKKFCYEDARQTLLRASNIRAQFTKNRFLSEISQKYHAPVLPYEEMVGVGQTYGNW